MSRHGARKDELGLAIRHSEWRMHADDTTREVVHACTEQGGLHLAIFGTADGWRWSACALDVTYAAGQAETAKEARHAAEAAARGAIQRKAQRRAA